MEMNGTVKGGVIVIDGIQPLPEGTRVTVRIEEQESKPQLSLAEKLLKHAGTVPDMPPDFAAQHDHYIRGTPKR